VSDLVLRRRALSRHAKQHGISGDAEQRTQLGAHRRHQRVVVSDLYGELLPLLNGPASS
jgi:hypothetical protein